MGLQLVTKLVIFAPPRNHTDIDEDDMERNYESSHSIHDKEYNTRMLLPIKTKDGVQVRYTDVVDRPEKIIGLHFGSGFGIPSYFYFTVSSNLK